jgi:adenine specific DNA methylase Mod
MPHEITKTELVWPGKYDEQGKKKEVERLSLPFQVIERVNESRATREAGKSRNPTLFDVWQGDSAETFEDGWRNKLIWGDNKLVMSSLLDQFAGKIDLIYIDPPFATGSDFSMAVPVGDAEREILKEPSLVEEKAYRDTWGRGTASFIEMLQTRLVLARELLSDTGSLFLHLDYRMAPFARLLLDEIFGVEHQMNEIIWRYRTYQGQVRSYFPRKHDNILWFAKGSATGFKLSYMDNVEDTIAFSRWRDFIVNGNEIRGDHYPKSDSRFNGYYQRWVKENQRTPGADDVLLTLTGYVVDDVWEDIQAVDPKDLEERVGYPTQKPEALLRRIIDCVTEPGDLVADFFSGSGTTAAVAEKLGRRWLVADLGRYAIHTARKRLLEIEGCRPFEVLNLGKYERKYWAVSTFGEDLDQDGVISLYEYIAFVLKMYGASATSGMQHLHGKSGSAFVHVGAVDSPVTIDEISACIDEAVAMKAKEVHVLGWEWEMGLHDPMKDIAESKGVKLVLRQVPREVMEQQAAAKGDVDFYELAYLDLEIKKTRKKREVAAHLSNFAIPNPELVPDEVRSKIKKWSDYVDYWAVDWNFSEDTFMQGWVTYRTRKDRRLELESDPHMYEEPGTYSVMVKVIDIFGNDTSKIVSVKVD